jgi:hypothetical protein
MLRVECPTTLVKPDLALHLVNKLVGTEAKHRFYSCSIFSFDTRSLANTDRRRERFSPRIPSPIFSWSVLHLPLWHTQFSIYVSETVSNTGILQVSGSPV